jgi:uncharacterized cupin superfamily protein
MKSLVKNLALLSAALLATTVAANAQLASKITHYDLSKTRNIKAVHDGAGSMNFGALMNDKTLSTNFIFLHRGVLHPGGGIGQHFHNHCEEMFVIFDGEAEFTINGRTSLLKGTVGAPDRMGSSHAIYNPTDHDVEWMNINVGTSKVYDAFNMGDDRVGRGKGQDPAIRHHAVGPVFVETGSQWRKSPAPPRLEPPACSTPPGPMSIMS